MKTRKGISRRHTLKGIGAVSASAILGSQTAHAEPRRPGEPGFGKSASHVRQGIFRRVWETPFVDTHEHLIEEKDRLTGTSHPRVQSDDWSILLSHYLNSDLITSGMPQDSLNKFFSPKTDPTKKWSLIEPHWPAVKNTGYGQAVNIALSRLYDVDELSAKTVRKVQSRYERVRRPGFYKHILCDSANIESCQVNCLSRPFGESDMPTLLMQDISIVGMFAGPALGQFGKPTGIQVSSLSDWYRVIDWWFEKYGKYAVAVKSQNAYSRDIDYDRVPAETVEGTFKRRLENKRLGSRQKKAIEDHLFWYAVEKATEHNLPVKLHTGYYAGRDSMPLARLINNPGSATELCRKAPDTRFVFMHICYPYYEEMIAIAKQYTNAYVDMCWAWIINPIAAKDFLKKYLVTAPANKILTFGGDYIPVEPVLGHAVIARRGIALALSELVEEGWLTLEGALDMVDPIMRGNAHKIFDLEAKTKLLKEVDWARVS
jgi:predicted TIM-barrel fold metal-dependent hydrolase